ncbi:hypothetical protein GYMLUDRAFT_156577 [Collybiopsis luxurians FD-317 M1]|nr:hypothetical protein GYMLUDRAFT_156577 [Collybiopsis luxurians FD-317 M1]
MIARTPGRLRSRALLLLAAVVSLYFLFSFFANSDSSPKISYSTVYSYADLKKQEETTARRFLKSVELIEGQKPRFVKFRQHQGGEFDSKALEILLHHTLALSAFRIYIYEPFNLQTSNEQVPLSTFLLGATEERAVPSSFIEEVCPKDSKDVVHVTLEASDTNFWKNITATLKQKEKCIFVDNPILDSSYLSSVAVDDLWRAFMKYLPRYFRWPPHIIDAVEYVQASLNLRPYFSSFKGEPYMALDLRRGDLSEHCKSAAESRSGFSNWANIPSISTQTLPPLLDNNNATSVMDHCYPPLSRVVDAIDHQIRRKPYIRAIHIIHDAAASSDVRKLEAAVKSKEHAQRAGWLYGPMQAVTKSSFVSLKSGTEEMSVAVDIEIARRAEIFVGNGYSNLTSFIIGLRMGGDLISAGISDDITLF